MATRTVTGHLLHPVTGLDWADATLYFRLRARFATNDFTLPPERTEVLTSASGTFSVNLMVPDSGASAVYGLLLPGNLDHEYTFYLPTGTAITLQELIQFGGDNGVDVNVLYDHIHLKATPNTLAHVKVGAGLSTTADGTLFVTGTFAEGFVSQIDFDNHVATLGTRTAPGHLQVGAGLGVSAGTVFLTGTYASQADLDATNSSLNNVALFAQATDTSLDIHTALAATHTVLGHVRAGIGLGVNAGTLFVTGTYANQPDLTALENDFDAHVLVQASPSVLGHMRVGAGLGVNAGTVFLTGTYALQSTVTQLQTDLSNLDSAVTTLDSAFSTHETLAADHTVLGHMRVGVGLGHNGAGTVFLTGTYASQSALDLTNSNVNSVAGSILSLGSLFDAHVILAANHTTLGHMRVGIGLGHNGAGTVFVTGTFLSLSDNLPTHPGTNSAGIGTTVSRWDHTHPLPSQLNNFFPIGGGTITGSIFRAPQFMFSGDTDSGIVLASDNVFGFYANNVEGIRFDTSGFFVRSDMGIRFASSTSFGTADVQITRDGVGALAISRLTSAAADLKIYQATGANYERLSIRGSSSLWQFISEIGGSITASKPFIFTYTDSATNDVVNEIQINRLSSGTPAANFGIRLTAKLQSSTTVERIAGGIEIAWETATDASRSGRTRIQANDSSAARTGFTVGTASSAPTISFYGGTLTAKQTVTGSRGGNAALADLLTKLAAFGLITDGSSA